MNTHAPIDFEQHRSAFEQQCYTYFESLKRRGWSNPAEGDGTPEALFWRHENGRYGVHSVEQAWQGFKMGTQHYQPTVAHFGGALQEIGTALGLLVGDDTTLKAVPQIEQQQRVLAATTEFAEKSWAHLLHTIRAANVLMNMSRTTPPDLLRQANSDLEATAAFIALVVEKQKESTQ